MDVTATDAAFRWSKARSWPDPLPYGLLHISHSSAGLFDRCERAWINKYAYPLLGKVLPYAFSPQGKLLPANAVVGTLADSVITLALHVRFQRGTWPALPSMEAAVLNLFQRYVAFSERWAAEARDYHPGYREDFHGIRLRAIDRIYFGEPFPEAEQRGMVARAQECVRRWVGAGFPDELDAYPAEAWCFPKPKPDALIPYFWLGEHPAWASFDFALRTESETLLYDWKTGNSVRQPEAVEQLHGYAAFAQRVWGDSPEAIRLVPVWLSDEPVSAPLLRADPARIDALLDRWRDRLALLRERLDEIRSDPDRLPALFPPAGEAWKCRGCPFRACEGYRRAEMDLTPPGGTQEEPFDGWDD